jgi:glutamate formiminotransferase / 5-formyltetrahydrofolate cyclo-ligase
MPVPALPLLAVPNVSEGRDRAAIEAIGAAFTSSGAARLLDVHSDADHHRSVFTLSGLRGSLAGALAAGAAEAVGRISVGALERSDGRECADGGEDSDGGEGVDGREGSDGREGAGTPRRGEHPFVGAVDVVPVVYLDPSLRGAACAEALAAAHLIGLLGVPVFLYGELAGADRGPAASRAHLRRGGVVGLAERIGSGELRPDFGPPSPHPSAGAVLVGARPPLVAFNLELAPPSSVADARRIAALIREGGPEGLPGLRAIGVALRGGEAGQVSMNVERPSETPLRVVVEAVRALAPLACAELVGLAPAAALADFPEDLPMPGFDPSRHVIENVLAGSTTAGPGAERPGPGKALGL